MHVDVRRNVHQRLSFALAPHEGLDKSVTITGGPSASRCTSCLLTDEPADVPKPAGRLCRIQSSRGRFRMTNSSQAIIDSMLASIKSSKLAEEPYRHWFLTDCLSPAAAEEVIHLPFKAPELGGISGKRELHNATRTYFDADNMKRFPVCKAFNEAFQSDQLTRVIASHFGTKLDGTYLRVEYAQDIDGFWLEPHTDLGVKVFTMLIYLSRDPSHANLGTDIYDINKKHVGRSPFRSNSALVFVPSHDTYHGFEPRPIQGVRKSLIINYVTNEWRAREQLAFPDSPIRH